LVEKPKHPPSTVTFLTYFACFDPFLHTKFILEPCLETILPFSMSLPASTKTKSNCAPPPPHPTNLPNLQLPVYPSTFTLPGPPLLPPPLTPSLLVSLSLFISRPPLNPSLVASSPHFFLLPTPPKSLPHSVVERNIFGLP
jgi:hypothetical protein